MLHTRKIVLVAFAGTLAAAPPAPAQFGLHDFGANCVRPYGSAGPYLGCAFLQIDVHEGYVDVFAESVSGWPVIFYPPWGNEEFLYTETRSEFVAHEFYLPGVVPDGWYGWGDGRVRVTPGSHRIAYIGELAGPPADITLWIDGTFLWHPIEHGDSWDGRCNIGGWSSSNDPCYPLPFTATPEPFTVALLGTGLAGLGLARRRRRMQ